MTMPNFLLIGAPKAGTTTLAEALEQHPEIYMCPIKEVGFFWAYEEGIRLAGPGHEKLRHRLVTKLEDYQRLFQGAEHKKAIGEASVRYLASPQAPARIHQFIPHAKLIVSLRQPAERAYAAFMHNVRDGLEVCSDFAEAISQELNGLRDGWLTCRYLDRGFYYQSLKRYLQFFPIEQMHISLMEDLIEDAQGLMRDLYRFLEVDETFIPDLSRKRNVSGIIRHPVLRMLWIKSNRLRAALRAFLPRSLRREVFEWITQDLIKEPLPLEIRAQLTEYYREDILRLQDLIRRDLSHWLI